jgi:hypothetical protein
VGLDRMDNLVDLVVVETIQAVHNLVEIDNLHTVALLSQIKDILVEQLILQQIMVLVVAVVPVLLVQMDLHLMVEMVEQENKILLQELHYLWQVVVEETFTIHHQLLVMQLMVVVKVLLMQDWHQEPVLQALMDIQTLVAAVEED